MHFRYNTMCFLQTLNKGNYYYYYCCCCCCCCCCYSCTYLVLISVSFSGCSDYFCDHSNPCVYVTQGNEDAWSVQDFMEFIVHGTVHGICRRMLKYSEEAGTPSTHKKSYLWWFENPACGDWSGSSWTGKDRVRVPPGIFFLREGGEVVVWFRVCGAPWANNDWANFGSAEVFFTYGEYSFSFKWSWLYSR